MTESINESLDESLLSPELSLQDNSNENDNELSLDDIEDIDGMGRKSAIEFVKRIPTFVRWIDDMNLTGLIVYKPKKQTTKLPLYGKKFVMSGSRDKKLISLLENLGAESGSGVSKNIDFLIINIIY